MKTLYIICIVLGLCLSFAGQAQDTAAGSKTLVIVAMDGQEPVPFASVVIYNLQQVQINVATTNMDGEARFVVVPLDTYIVKAVHVTYFVTSDTLHCSLPRCNRRDTLRLTPDRRYLDHWTGSVESPEEYEELERMRERAEEQNEIKEDLNDFVCFPNPVRDMLRIEVIGIEASELLILDNKAAVVFRREVTLEDYEFEFDVSHLAAGHYLVICKGAGMVSNTKTIIKLE